MLKSALFFCLLNVSLVAAAQPDLQSIVNGPFSDEHRQFVLDLTAGFQITDHPEGDFTPTESWRTWKMVENYSFGKDRGSLPMIADLEALHPYFREKVMQLIAICQTKGIELELVETYRTHAKQNEYKSMGRKYTRSAGGHSKHQYGLAVDVVPVVDSVAQWDNYRLWKKVGAIGESLGLRWGGRWRNPYDPGHFEWTGGLSSYHLANGLLPSVPKSYHNPCLTEDLMLLSESWKAWETEQATISRKSVASSKMN